MNSKDETTTEMLVLLAVLFVIIIVVIVILARMNRKEKKPAKKKLEVFSNPEQVVKPLRKVLEDLFQGKEVEVKLPKGTRYYKGHYSSDLNHYFNDYTGQIYAPFPFLISDDKQDGKKYIEMIAFLNNKGHIFFWGSNNNFLHESEISIHYDMKKYDNNKENIIELDSSLKQVIYFDKKTSQIYINSFGKNILALKLFETNENEKIKFAKKEGDTYFFKINRQFLKDPKIYYITKEEILSYIK